jgi:hypothetical protein
VDVEVVVLIECDFVCVENVKPASDRPEIAGEDVALSVVFVGEG